jgi:thioredoxin 1
MKYISIIGLLVVAVLYFSFTSIGNNKTSSDENIVNQASSAKVTFVELGSVNCIPCKQMQPIMKSIEEKYGDQVKVVFYDVWKEDQKKYAQQYGIKLIPTQVFLDAKGKEFHRHEGFYPEAEIDKILQGKGLKPKKS